ncbi:MAG TPA: HTH domain-containing protein [Gemmatimonadales bacterium]
MGKFKVQRRLTRGTSGQIIELLRRKAMTIDELAAAIGVTRTAIRAHLATLQQDGAIEQRGVVRGVSKPARTYGVTTEAELLLSKAYVPILTQLLHVLANRIPGQEFDAILREVGRGLMAGHVTGQGTLRERAIAASDFLNDLGGTTEVAEEGGQYVIRGYGCPIAAATAEHPEACSALESLLTEFVGRPVTKCCEEYQRQRCCFIVRNGGAA